MDLNSTAETPQRRSVRRTEVALYGVYEISKLLTGPARLDVTLAKVAEVLASFLDMRHGLIALLEPDGSTALVVGSGRSPETAKRYFERLPERAIGRIVTTQMPLVIPNMKEDPLFEHWDFSEWGDEEDVAFVGVPIKDEGRVVGTLTVDSETRTHTEVGFDHDVRFLTMVANLLGQAVRLQRLLEQDRQRLLEERRRLEREIEQAVVERNETPPNGIVGSSPALRAVISKVRAVARSHSTVLLRGESGTGKELFARALHDLSPRRSSPFVKVNCAALPESVLESELFGHERGAFTGASAQRKGRFELADGGTLFLDEIGEISASFQAKLLRVLQEGEFERVGGSATLKVDVRLVAATNRNLEEAVSLGEFRADLYYRISVVPIFLPPLRERPTDIPLLAERFLSRFNSEHSTALQLAEDGLSVMSACQFPGNVRELENCIRRTATLASGPDIHARDFACSKDECLSAALWRHAPAAPERFVPLPIVPGPRAPSVLPAPPSASAAEGPEALDAESAGGRERLIQAMEAAGWVQAKAARLLGLTPRQIGYALRKHAIPIKKF